MARLPVDVELEILIVDQEATSLLVDGKVSIVALRQQVHVVTVGQLSLHLDAGLAMHIGTTLCVYIAPVVLLTTLAQTRLHLGTSRLQIMMHHIKVLERRKLAIRRQHGNYTKYNNSLSVTSLHRLIDETYPSI